MATCWCNILDISMPQLFSTGFVDQHGSGGLLSHSHDRPPEVRLGGFDPPDLRDVDGRFDAGTER